MCIRKHSRQNVLRNPAVVMWLDFHLWLFCGSQCTLNTPTGTWCTAMYTTVILGRLVYYQASHQTSAERCSLFFPFLCNTWHASVPVFWLPVLLLPCRASNAYGCCAAVNPIWSEGRDRASHQRDSVPGFRQALSLQRCNGWPSGGWVSEWVSE